MGHVQPLGAHDDVNGCLLHLIAALCINSSQLLDGSLGQERQHILEQARLLAVGQMRSCTPRLGGSIAEAFPLRVNPYFAALLFLPHFSLSVGTRLN